MSDRSSQLKDLSEVVGHAVQEHARALILKALWIAPGYTLNEQILRDILDSFGLRLSEQKMIDIVDWLQQHQLIKIIAGEVRVITLLRSGADVAEDRTQIEGVARAHPDDLRIG